MNSSSKRILLVEDSLRDAELILDALPDNLGDEVMHLRDGAEALGTGPARHPFEHTACCGTVGCGGSPACVPVGS